MHRTVALCIQPQRVVHIYPLPYHRGGTRGASSGAIVELFERVGSDGAVSIIGRWPAPGGNLPHRSARMEQRQAPGATRGEPAIYQITVKDQLSADWGVWFDGMTITRR